MVFFRVDSLQTGTRERGTGWGGEGKLNRDLKWGSRRGPEGGPRFDEEREFSRKSKSILVS